VLGPRGGYEFGGPAQPGFIGFIEELKPGVPLVLLPPVMIGLWFVFRNTWRELDEDAHRHRAALLAQGRADSRPFVAFVMCAMILTLQEYFGGRVYFDAKIHKLLVEYDTLHPHVIEFRKYEELWGYVWWAGTRIGGYVFVPFGLWKLLYPKDSLLDLGLRTKGFWSHIWIYLSILAFILPVTYIASRAPDFRSYYPFYKASTRSWFDFLAWESMYFAQFLALEMFFRGFWIGVLRRSLGSGAIFAMAVPYCMIHYGKPYLETCGAIIAGIFLGSLSMRTKSIYQGFLVHISVAALMDWLALAQRGALPTELFPPNFPN
jgi:membrane protease YdiL (CAAX protease family)